MFKIEKATKELLLSEPICQVLKIPVDILLYNQQLGCIINCLLIDKLVVGYCMYTIENSSINIQVHPSHQQNGYGEKLCIATIKEIFNHPDIHQIKIQTMVGKPSNKLAIKLGFKRVNCTEKECFYVLERSVFSSNHSNF